MDFRDPDGWKLAEWLHPPMNAEAALKHQPASIVPGMITYVEVPRMDILYRGVLVNSALYLLTVWATGLAWSRPWAVYTAIAALGFTYLNYLALAVQREETKNSVLARLLYAASLVLGIAAGLLLLGGR